VFRINELLLETDKGLAEGGELIIQAKWDHCWGVEQEVSHNLQILFLIAPNVCAESSISKPANCNKKPILLQSYLPYSLLIRDGL
jgi:hypothetical protein